jgi:phosphoglycolate phosphatase
MPELIDSIFHSIRGGEQKWLLLFDIDGTLVDTGGRGMAALRKAALDIFQNEGPELDLAGSTDLGIFENICQHFDIRADQELNHHFFETYHRHLEASLENHPNEGRVIAGARELLEQLSPKSSAQLALLTGNTAPGAAIKLRHYGLHSYFQFGAYGSDQADRNLLGPIALERALASTGHSFDPSQTLIIGDTPKDISCAHAMGARCLAVATGKFTKSELQDAGGDWVLNSLLDLDFLNC